MITRKELGHLSELARMALPEEEEEKLLADFDKIFAHFEELKNVKTEHVVPMTGGTFEKNVFRSDEAGEPRLPKEKAIEQFPEKERGYLKTPPVF